MKNRAKEAGITLPELMISLGIMSFGGIIGTSLFLNSQKEVDNIQHRNTMQMIARSLEVAVQNAEVIAFSALTDPANADLKRCIFNDDALTKQQNGQFQIDTNGQQSLIAKSAANTFLCTATDPMKQIPIKLRLAPANWANANTSQLLIAGTGEDPVWYNTLGNRNCSPSDDPQCIFAVSAYFWAYCPRGSNEIRQTIASGSQLNSALPSSCDRAQSVNIRFQVVHVPQSRGEKKSSRSMPSIPHDEVFWQDASHSLHTTNYAYPFDVSQFGAYSEFIGMCKTNYTLIEIVDSKPKCQCLPPYKELTSSLGKTTCILPNHHCGPKERFAGTKIDGSPICTPVVCEEKTITFPELGGKGGGTTVTSHDMLDTSCGPNGWLNKVAIFNKADGNCRCVPTLQKRSGSENWVYECKLKCALTIRCCYEQK